MNATAQYPPPSTEPLDALADWQRLVDFIDRWGIADRVLTVTRSLYGFPPTINLEMIADIERRFANSGLRMSLSVCKSGNLHAELIVEGVRVCACGRRDGRIGEVTL